MLQSNRMNTIQLTKEGVEQLKRELADLESKSRPETVERLTKARSMGDLKENNAYHAAKEELGDIDGRILEIKHILKNAIIIEKDNSGTAQLGSTLTVEVDGATRTFSIVGEFESDPMNGKLSQTSPIGAALLGAKVGMSVNIQLPAGTKTYKILKIT